MRQKFTQKERDVESGLDYFLARYYSASQGRFTSPDEFTGGPRELYEFPNLASRNPTFYADIADPRTLNKYQYSINSPFQYVDPDGHQQTKSLTERLKESYRALGEYIADKLKFNDSDDPKDDRNKTPSERSYGPGGEMPDAKEIAGRSLETFAKGMDNLADALELLDQTGGASIVRSAIKGDKNGVMLGATSALIPTKNLGSKISQQIIGKVIGSKQGTDILAKGGREAAKQVFREFALKEGRVLVNDAKRTARGVAGKLADGTHIRIRFKRDGSTRLQVGKDKFIFPVQ